MRLRHARLAVVALPLLLGGCETMDAIRSFNVADYVNLPWHHRTTAAPEKTADDAKPAPVETAQAVNLDGLQRDDLRAPYGDESAVAVASRDGL